MFTLDLNPQIHLEYLAEGAANVVYKIRTPPPSPGVAADINFESHDYDSSTPPPSEIPPLRIDPILEGKLVRLRKNAPSAVPALESQTQFEQLIQPLFPAENTVQQILFHPTPALLADANKTLLEMERQGTRPPTRHGTYLLTSEPHGYLITDMTPSSPSSAPLAHEFKPKWLAQSPSAPPGSRRCRTCALRAMKRPDRETPPKSPRSGFCPLNLVSLDRARVETAVDSIMGLDRTDESAWNPETATIHARLVDFLHKNPLLARLRELQLELDPRGVLSANVDSVAFLTAMTLRDCTLFLRFPPTTTTGPVEARLGDLDLKSSKGQKASYWLRVERQLIEGGWYTGTEEGGGEGENYCLLS